MPGRGWTGRGEVCLSLSLFSMACFSMIRVILVIFYYCPFRSTTEHEPPFCDSAARTSSGQRNACSLPQSRILPKLV